MNIHGDFQGLIHLSRDENISLRQELIPRACGLHFEKAPLKVVRGNGVYLYSDLGEELLDCVNCVAHVGHCHPSVVEAGKNAMTRLGATVLQKSDIVTDYISQLKTTLPSEFDTFLFLSSGSEAIDLAIQIARLYTQGEDVVSIERSFHGSVSIPNDVSPKQFISPSHVPGYVHVLSCPDMYRGKYTSEESDAIKKYCDDARETITKVQESGQKIACLIVEPVMTLAGMIIPPSQWMQCVYNEIRTAGGVTIADETQSGLGRPGTTWWSFQLFKNLIPDIITIGKPVGNGYPMAVVGLTSKISSKLPPELLSKFECDDVRAAVGIGVLKTVKSEQLMHNAHIVGSFLTESLRKLTHTHPMIGEVRGQGLMLGIEIIYDQKSKKPAPSVAEEICYKMKEENVIIANEGIFKNILLMMPPMCFTVENAQRVVTVLDKVLQKIEYETLILRNHSMFPLSSSRTHTTFLNTEGFGTNSHVSDASSDEENSEIPLEDAQNVFDMLD